ncbi:hypothetical protein ACHAPT_009895 [Fusarium lateritium]
MSLGLSSFQSLPKQRGAKEATDDVPPLIRLQVWHFSRAGRNFEFNRRLAVSFSRVERAGWSVLPSESPSREKNRRDEFVPAEVDFQFQPSSQEGSLTSPDEPMQMLFYETLPPIIKGFFKDHGKEPQHLNMFPVGESVDRSTIQKYTHFMVLHSLAVEQRVVNRIIRQIAEVDEDAQELAYKKIGDLPYKSVQGHSLSDEWLAVEESLERSVEAGKHVKAVSESKKQASYRRSCAAQECYREFESFLEKDAKKLLQPGAVVGNQDLYLGVTQMAAAFQIAPWYRKERDLYASLVFDPAHVFGALVVGVLALRAAIYFSDNSDLYWGPSGYLDYESSKTWCYAIEVSCIMMSFIMCLVVVVQLAEYFTLKSANKITDIKLNNLRVTQSVMAAKFCTQVLKMPPEMMTTGERKVILRDLGIDVRDDAPRLQRRILEAFVSKLD